MLWAYICPVFIQCFSGATPGIPGVAPEKHCRNYGEIQSLNRQWIGKKLERFGKGW
ncbi:MAG: hypothetical protein WD625_11305 [Balneolales bacterium]